MISKVLQWEKGLIQYHIHGAGGFLHIDLACFQDLFTNVMPPEPRYGDSVWRRVLLLMNDNDYLDTSFAVATSLLIFSTQIAH